MIKQLTISFHILRIFIIAILLLELLSGCGNPVMPVASPAGPENTHTPSSSPVFTATKSPIVKTSESTSASEKETNSKPLVITPTSFSMESKEIPLLKNPTQPITPPSKSPTGIPYTTVPNPTNTPNVPPDQMTYQCLTYTEELPSDFPLNGIFVMQDQSLFLLDSQTWSRTTLYEENSTWTRPVVSPNGQWLAYQWRGKSDIETDLGNELFIVASDGHIEKTMPTENGWDFIWLNNERLLTRPMNWDESTLQTLSVFDPFNKTTRQLTNSFQDIYYLDGVYWGFFTSSRTVYEPTLTKVLYPQIGQDSSVILWDLRQGKELARLPTTDPYGKSPKWAPDGQQVSIILETGHLGQRSPWNYHQDLFSINQGGKITQLTDLSNYFQSVFIGDDYSWSPEGNKIAFWMGNHSADPYVGLQLVILDTLTGHTTNFCDFGNHSNLGALYPEPVWSPDGTQLLVEISDRDATTERRSAALLVDIDRGVAAKIGANVTPVGWMKQFNSDTK